MNTFLYIIIFILGTLFGSFYTLGVYRIPKRQDILHKRSYCPNCNHKLGLLDLCPIISYILLGGKCRYCKEKIRPRYLIIETLSGILFLVMAYLLDVTFETLTISNIVNYSFMVLYLTFIILMAGINKETKNIDKYVNIYGIVITLLYMVYLYIVEEANIYRYVIYIVIGIIMLLLANVRKKNIYISAIVGILVPMLLYTGEYITINSILVTLIVISFIMLKEKTKRIEENRKEDIKENKEKESAQNKIDDKKSDKEILKNIPIAFILGVSNIILLVLILGYYRIK